MKLFASLCSRALLVILLATLPLLAGVIDSYRRERVAAIAAIDEDIRDLLRLALRQEAEVVKDLKLTLSIMINAIEMKQPTAESCSGLAGRLMKSQPDFANLGAVWPDGALYCSARPMTQAVSVADRAWFQEVAGKKRFSAGYYHLGRVSGERAVTYGLPQLDQEGQLRTTVFAAVKLDWFVRLLESTQLPPDWHALIVTRDGFVAASYPPELPAAHASATEILNLLGAPPTEAVVRSWRHERVEHLHGTVPLASTQDALYLIIGADTQHIMAPIETRFRYQIGLALLFAGASALLAWFALRGSVLIWVGRMNAIVREFGAGRLATRAGRTSGVAELQALADNFDAMAARIEHSNDELEARVAARTADLARSNTELEAFAYSVSHDLRAPLRAIAGFAEILNDRHRGQLDAEGRRHLDNVLGAASQMNRLIDDLLQYSRVGRGMIRRERIDLAPLLQNLLKLFQPRLAAGGRIDIVEPLASPSGDPRLLGQILTNLIDNALKYQPPGQAPLVRIDSTAHDGEVTIRVTDNGIGVPPEQRAAIFTAFHRLHDDAEYPGTGIGLAIALKAARLMEGTLTVEPAPDRPGSCFILRLPANPPTGEE